MESQKKALLPAIPGWLFVALGLLAVPTALYGSVAQPPRVGFIRTWMASAAVGYALTTLAVYFRARRNGQAMFRTDAINALVRFAVTFLAGAMMTELLYYYFRDEALGATWLLLYGTGLMAAATGRSRLLMLMGCTFIGLAAWWWVQLRAFGLTPIPGMRMTPPDMLLLIGFGGVHFVFGLLRIVGEYLTRRRAAAA